MGSATVPHVFYLKRTPIRRADHQITWHDRFAQSSFIIKVNLSGMPIGLSISREALAFDKSRTTQSIVDLSSMQITPAFLRRRLIPLFSFIGMLCLS